MRLESTLILLSIPWDPKEAELLAPSILQVGSAGLEDH